MKVVKVSCIYARIVLCSNFDAFFVGTFSFSLTVINMVMSNKLMLFNLLTCYLQTGHFIDFYSNDHLRCPYLDWYGKESY